ncbi:uncharacterized protein N7484_008187 [Penicillium longicatenatum]|uniref:uncharacterized protein n=1 Tax=Penicillium longicatenatum TaxID=1561947 RepID=UPI00254971CD|nr:uncharacterized protein N7484_008187 [Penicillium longicatenatum]KAJ5640325.1 hypothetical protein N7484_008187 [Penicillium longicatenatum]
MEHECDDVFAELYSNWRQGFPSKPTRHSDIWSVTESALASEGPMSGEDDCPFEYTNDQSCAEGLHEALEEDLQDEAEGEHWIQGTQNLARYGNETAQDKRPQVPEEIRRVFTYLDSQVEGIKGQLGKQGVWNKSIQQSVETIAAGYDEFKALKETLEALQEDIDKLRLAQEGTTERRTGRNKRIAQ